MGKKRYRGIALLILLTGCVKPRQTTAPIPAATVAVSPYEITSPFLCRLTDQDLTCMATIDVRFRRGQLEEQFRRGHQFSFTAPKGTGKVVVWYGCAGTNECGSGYFMASAAKGVTVTPVEPARFWAGGSDAVPYGSHGIVEADIVTDRFTEMRNRWTTSSQMPQLKAGPGISISCTDQACTISATK